MKNAKVIGGILFIFVLGIIVGTLMTRMFYEGRIDALVKGDSQAREDETIKRLSRHLDLSDKQRDQVRIIVRETRGEIKVTYKQIRPQITTTLEKSERKIKELLQPGQIVKYDKIIAERKGR
jgi:hypothetical protein